MDASELTRTYDREADPPCRHLAAPQMGDADGPYAFDDAHPWRPNVQRLPCGCPIDSGCDSRHESAYGLADMQASA